MNFSLSRVFQSAVVAAILEVGADIIRSQSFHLVPVGIYTLIQLIFFFIVLCIAALVCAPFKSSTWFQRILFFIILLAPSIFSYFLFYRNVSFYQQGGSVFVQNHEITSSGIGSFILNIAVSALVALVATAVYFRRTAQIPQDTAHV